MDDYIEVSAKTVDDAITEALLKLETTSDKIEQMCIRDRLLKQYLRPGEGRLFYK